MPSHFFPNSPFTPTSTIPTTSQSLSTPIGTVSPLPPPTPKPPQPATSSPATSSPPPPPPPQQQQQQQLPPLSPHLLNYLLIPFLISLSKDLPSPSPPEQSPPPPPPTPVVRRRRVMLNYRPVIGILSHPGDGASGRLNNSENVSYISASYVKFVESAGARVIPLIYNEPPEILFEKLNLVNGVLFTGGRAKSGLYFDTVKAIFKKVLSKNDAGEHFPLCAICLGFELLSMIISKDDNILESFDAKEQASTLHFMDNTSIEGTLFQRFPPYLLQKLRTDCLVMQNHHILTISSDRDNKAYVSTVQANKYPVTAFQWHPEKNAFEWGLPMIPHSEDAIHVTQHVANHFISEARKSLNRPPGRKVLDNLIYNYSPTYCGKAGRGYDEVYIFTRKQIEHPKL